MNRCAEPNPPTLPPAPLPKAVRAISNALDSITYVCVCIGLQESGEWALVVRAPHH